MRTFALLLALAAVGAWVHPPDRHRTDWPPLPSVVQGLGGPITVKLVVDPKDEEGNELWGSWEQSKRLIEIDSEASPEFRWHTLGHELCHATLGDSGHEYLLEEKQIEALCDALATSRMAEMRGALNLP